MGQQVKIQGSSGAERAASAAAQPDWSAAQHSAGQKTPSAGRLYVERLIAGMDARLPLPRALSEEEIAFMAGAREAGAVIVPRKLREFLAGARGPDAYPIQFEGCHLFLEDMDNEVIVAAVEQACAKRDAWFAAMTARGR